METHTSHEHTAHHAEHIKNSIDPKTFYICVGILAFSIIVLQPFAMLLVIFTQALMQ